MAVVAVLYIAVNIRNHFGPVVAVANNSAGLIFFRVGRRDLSICFSDKPSL